MNPIIKKLKSKKEQELFRRCDEIIHYIWDPVGSKDIPLARDEYYGYLPQIFTLLKNGADKVKISDHLSNLENTSFGMNPNSDRNKEVAELLIETKEALFD